MRRHWRKILIVGFLIAGVGFVALNMIAYQHAWAMTHFVRNDAPRTAPPEQLSTWGKIKVLFTGVSIPRPENRRTPRDAGMGYETHRFTGAKGLELEAWRIPNASSPLVVILFHGYASAKDSQLDSAQALYHMGYECWLVDFHGSGGSTGDTTGIGWDEATDVAASFRFIQERSKGRRIILFGSSLGAAAILRAVAKENIQPNGLILECPFNNLLETTGNRFRAMNLPPFPLASLLVYWGGKQGGFDGTTHNPAHYALSVKCNVLVMNGDKDSRVTLPNIQQVLDNLPKGCSFEVFKDTGHESYLKKHPQLWKRTAQAWLEGHRQAAERQKMSFLGGTTSTARD